jgi:hypothetical protein
MPDMVVCLPSFPSTASISMYDFGLAVFDSQTRPMPVFNGESLDFRETRCGQSLVNSSLKLSRSNSSSTGDRCFHQAGRCRGYCCSGMALAFPGRYTAFSGKSRPRANGLVIVDAKTSYPPFFPGVRRFAIHSSGKSS